MTMDFSIEPGEDLTAIEAAWWNGFPDVKPGDTIAVRVGGLVYTDQVASVTVKRPAPPYVPASRRSRWQRLRALTPRRWRKPLPYTPLSGASVIDFTLGERTPWADHVADMQRAQRNLEAMGRAVDALAIDELPWL